jgi:hypothetical protein
VSWARVLDAARSRSASPCAWNRLTPTLSVCRVLSTFVVRGLVRNGSAFYADEHVVVLSALIREKFLKVRVWLCVAG